jgi:hypothetical protein
MRFLSFIWLTPIALFVLSGLVAGNHRPGTVLSAIGAISLVWLWVDLPMTVLYICYRIFFRAKRDSHRY